MDTTPQPAELLATARQILDRMATPEYQATGYLANAIHLHRCGSSPDHGPYAHEDEAQEYAHVLAEVGLLAEQVPAGMRSGKKA